MYLSKCRTVDNLTEMQNGSHCRRRAWPLALESFRTRVPCALHVFEPSSSAASRRRRAISRRRRSISSRRVVRNNSRHSRSRVVPNVPERRRTRTRHALQPAVSPRVLAASAGRPPHQPDHARQLPLSDRIRADRHGGLHRLPVPLGCVHSLQEEVLIRPSRLVSFRHTCS